MVSKNKLKEINAKSYTELQNAKFLYTAYSYVMALLIVLYFTTLNI